MTPETRRARLLGLANAYLGHAINCLDMELEHLRVERSCHPTETSALAMIRAEKGRLFGTLKTLEAAREELLAKTVRPHPEVQR